MAWLNQGSKSALMYLDAISHYRLLLWLKLPRLFILPTLLTLKPTNHPVLLRVLVKNKGEPFLNAGASL